MDSIRRLQCVVACGAMATLMAVAACGQVQWTQARPALVPPVMFEPCGAYDDVRRVMVVVGGTSYRPAITWEWNGVDWLARQPRTQPTFGYCRMAYDAVRRRCVLVSVLTNKPTLVTWEWDGFDWTLRAPRNPPPHRIGFAIAYDAGRRRVVLFGGVGHNDTWEWDGSDWTRQYPVSSPPSRDGHAMAFDARMRRVILFGGKSTWPFADTWVWQGATWIRKVTTVRPLQRHNHRMVHDAVRGRTLLFGGQNGLVPYSDTWEWDGSAWSQCAPAVSPPWKVNAAMAYHAATRRVVLFGGSSGTPPFHQPGQDTWEWGDTWLGGSGTPRPGQTVNLALTSTRDAGRPYQLASALATGPIPVGPLALGLQFDPLFWISVSDGWPNVFRRYRGRLDAGGQATATIAIPGSSSLVGTAVHTAFLVIDPGAGAPFRSVSNTVSLSIKP